MLDKICKIVWAVYEIVAMLCVFYHINFENKITVQEVKNGLKM